MAYDVTSPRRPHTFVTKEPSSAASLRAIELMRGFIARRGRG